MGPVTDHQRPDEPAHAGWLPPTAGNERPERPGGLGAPWDAALPPAGERSRPRRTLGFLDPTGTPGARLLIAGTVLALAGAALVFVAEEYKFDAEKALTGETYLKDGAYVALLLLGLGCLIVGVTMAATWVTRRPPR